MKASFFLLSALLLSSCSNLLSPKELNHVPKGFISPLEKIFVINLDRSPDRLLAIQKQFDQMSLHFERFPAVEGRKYESKYRQRLPDESYVQTLDDEGSYTYRYDSYRRKRGLVPGEIGCYLSHYEVLKKVVADEIAVALVLEDDITFPKDFESRLQSILAHAPDSWDIIYLYYNFGVGMCRGEFPLTSDRRFFDLTRSGCVTGTVGYLVSNQGAQKLVKNLMPAVTTIDGQISEEFLGQEHGPFKGYAVYPQLLSLGGFSPTIENRTE